MLPAPLPYPPMPPYPPPLLIFTESIIGIRHCGAFPVFTLPVETLIPASAGDQELKYANSTTDTCHLPQLSELPPSPNYSCQGLSLHRCHILCRRQTAPISGDRQSTSNGPHSLPSQSWAIQVQHQPPRCQHSSSASIDSSKA